jgi:hypothetical protein
LGESAVKSDAITTAANPADEYLSAQSFTRNALNMAKLSLARRTQCRMAPCHAAAKGSNQARGGKFRQNQNAKYKMKQGNDRRR